MLILSRRPGEAILLDGGIRLVVVACDRRGVRLGIEAPPEVGIVREELAREVAAENQRAPATDGTNAWIAKLPPVRPVRDGARPAPAASAVPPAPAAPAPADTPDGES